MDTFYTVSKCDRCGGSLEGGRILSMFNTDVLCMKCKDEERKRPDYKAAQEADIAEIKKGNYNFEEMGYNNERKVK